MEEGWLRARGRWPSPPASETIFLLKGFASKAFPLRFHELAAPPHILCPVGIPRHSGLLIRAGMARPDEAAVCGQREAGSEGLF